jgi:hypothetical protein
MDPRVLTAAVIGLVLMALGAFYFALSPRSGEAILIPPKPAPSPSAAAPPVPAAIPPQPAPPPMATPASVEAELALSEHAELQALLKKNFTAEYNELIATAVRRRNEGVPDAVFGQELAERFQEIVRGRLKFGVWASMPTIDRLAANEASLFHALGTEGARLCMKMLGRDDSTAAAPQPESIRQLMRMGTLYRFQAVVEGMSNTRPAEALSSEEMRAFEGSLAREGLILNDVTSGAYLNRGVAEPGRPCLTLETLHLAIARLPEGTRRKIYAGMFFLGRDR